MSRTFLFSLITLLGIYASAQEIPSFGTVKSHEYYVGQLANAKDQDFQQIIGLYNDYILRNPDDIIAKIELCKFIGNSYIDEYEEYNLKYQETEACISNLANAHPENPKVLIYQAQNAYGEDKLELLNTGKNLIETNRTAWLNDEIAEINRMLGDYHYEEKLRALRYYKKAQKFNDELDLSLDIGKIYYEQGELERAKEVLLPSLEKDTALWVLNQKADLLIKMDEPQKAMSLFDAIEKRDSTFIDNEEMANALTGLGNFKTAREFLVRDTIQEWGKLNAKQRLFNHDVKHSSGTTTLSTYRELQKESTYDDFFGIKRFRIFLKDPFLWWNSSDVFRIFLLHILVLIAFLVPYLWVLPVFGLGTFLKKNNVSIVPKLNFTWNIGHFWLISFLYVLATIVTIFIFEYQENINYYFDLGSSYGSEDTDQELLANEMILFVLFMAGATLLVLNRKKLGDVLRTNSSVRQMIGLSILFVVFNRIFIKGLSFFVDLESDTGTNIILNAQEEIMAVMSQYGFLATALLVALIVPIYEEIIFRGVILGSVEKYIGFKGANVFQATLFASVHDELSLFPFFFVFALITGYWVKRSKGLLTGIFFHGIHNLTILIALYYILSLKSVGV